MAPEVVARPRQRMDFAGIGLLRGTHRLERPHRRGINHILRSELALRLASKPAFCGETPHSGELARSYSGHRCQSEAAQDVRPVPSEGQTRGTGEQGQGTGSDVGPFMVMCSTTPGTRVTVHGLLVLVRGRDGSACPPRRLVRSSFPDPVPDPFPRINAAFLGMPTQPPVIRPSKEDPKQASKREVEQPQSMGGQSKQPQDQASRQLQTQCQRP